MKPGARTFKPRTTTYVKRRGVDTSKVGVHLSDFVGPLPSRPGSACRISEVTMEEKRKAAREVIDILQEISLLLVARPACPAF